MAQESKSRKLDQYIVRFPDGMRDKLKDEAEHNNRSLNAEIISRLEDTLGQPQQPSDIVKKLEVMVSLQKDALASQKRMIDAFNRETIFQRMERERASPDWKEVEYLKRANSIIALVLRDIAMETKHPTLSRLTAILDSHVIEGSGDDIASIKQSALGLIDLLDAADRRDKSKDSPANRRPAPVFVDLDDPAQARTLVEELDRRGLLPPPEAKMSKGKKKDG